MEARRVPALHGALWVAHGYSLFRAFPVAWLMLFPLVWMAIFAMVVIPFIGPLIALVMMPGLTAGMMFAAGEAQHKRMPGPAALLMPLRARPRVQLALGFAYAASVFCAFFILLWVLPPATPRPSEMPHEPREMLAMLPLLAGALLLYLPIMMAFWFAPALCHWHAMKPAKAVFFSFFAGMRNIRAFIVYGAVWLFLQVLAPMAASELAAALLPKGQATEFILALIFVPYGLVVACTFVCSYYSSYVAILPEQPEVPPPPP